MKVIFNNLSICLFLMILVLVGCKTEKKADATKEDVKIEKENIIEIITRSMEFQSPDTIASGWNTFRYQNLSNETHFVVFEKYPEGITIDSTRTQVFPVFDKGMDLINEGKNEEGFTAFNKLPVWFFNVEFTGGIGLLSPNKMAESTINLDPGRYLIECYVKMKNGKFHSVMGMCKEIIVTDSNSNNNEPIANVDVEISSENGIVFNPAIKSGENMFKVQFIDQKAHEHFLGHDVNIVKLNEGANEETLEAWLNWVNPKGLIDPAPNNVIFLGGMQEMIAGKEGYFKVNLQPGKYALVAEVPNAIGKNMLKTFQIVD